MYAQVEKTKDNKSEVVANSVGQKKINVKQGFGFVDNRPESITQRKLQSLANNYQPVQKMSDGSRYSNALLAGVSEHNELLKQKGNGSFLMMKLDWGHINHFHAHLFNPETEKDKVKVTGHVKTAKGDAWSKTPTGIPRDSEGNAVEEKSKADSNKTKITLTGEQIDTGRWKVETSKEKSEIGVEYGSPEVPVKHHDAAVTAVLLGVERVLHHTMNSTDRELFGAISALMVSEQKYKKEREAKAEAKRNEKQEDDDVGLGEFNLFD